MSSTGFDGVCSIYQRHLFSQKATYGFKSHRPGNSDAVSGPAFCAARPAAAAAAAPVDLPKVMAEKDGHVGIPRQLQRFRQRC